MKKSIVAEIKNFTIEELRGKISQLRKNIADGRIDLSSAKVTDKKTVFKLRKTLAVHQTVLRQKQLLAELTDQVEVKVETEDKKGKTVKVKK